LKVFAETLSALEASEDDLPVGTLLADVDRSVALLRGMKLSLDDIVADLYDFATLLRCTATPKEVLASDVSAAVAKVEVLRFKALSSALHSSAAGKAVLSSAACVLQVSAKDTCGDQKLALASKVISDPRLPNLQLPTKDDEDAEGRDGAIIKFSYISEMSIVSVLEEAMGHVAEAFSLWSPTRLQQQASSVEAWLQQLAKSIHFYDEALGLFLQGVVADSKLGELIYAADDASWSVEDEVAAFLELSSILEQHGIDAQPLFKFVEKLLTFVEKAPDAIQRLVSFGKYADDLKTKVMTNIVCQDRIWNLLECLTQMTELPKTPQDALDEWIAKRSAGDEANSFFCKGVRVSQAIDHLAKSNLSLNSDDDGEIRLVLDEGSGDVIFVGSWARARRLPLYLRRLLIPAYVKNLANQGLQVVLGNFGKSLHLRAVKTETISTFLLQIGCCQPAVRRWNLTYLLKNAGLSILTGAGLRRLDCSSGILRAPPTSLLGYV